MLLVKQSNKLHFTSVEDITVVELSKFLEDLFAAYEGALFIESLIEKGGGMWSEFLYQEYRDFSSNGFLRFLRAAKRSRLYESKWKYRLKHFPQLHIESIKLGSPGDFNFFGLPDPIKSISDLIHEINSQRRWKKEHELKRKEQTHKIRTENKRLRMEEAEHIQKQELNQLEIIAKKIELLQAAGYSDEEIQKYLKGFLLNPTKKLAEQNPKFLLGDY